MDIKKFEKAASREQYDAALKEAIERLEAVMRLRDVDPIEFAVIVLNREADSCEIQGSISENGHLLMARTLMLQLQDLRKEKLI